MFTRKYSAILRSRLQEPRRFIQVVAGPRQVGKTTLVRQVLDQWEGQARPISADEPTLHDRAWLVQQWESARSLANAQPDGRTVLAVDEIQKIPGWSETVKRLWDEDTAAGAKSHVILLGSAPLLVQKGLTESLAGRFELIVLPHWSLAEMQAAFGFSLEQYLFYGGYPGGAALVGDPDRWRSYIRDSLIETTIGRDILLMIRVDKPALLRRLFDLTCRHAGQIVSYAKMIGQLQDAGNTTTLAHYLDLLHAVGLAAGLPKYAGNAVRQRAASPKLQVLNNALLTAQAGVGFQEALGDPVFKGRLVESAVGAHLLNAAATGACSVYYWRHANHEVDFVVRSDKNIMAIEVKSGRRRDSLPGVAVFIDQFKGSRSLLVGGDGIPVAEFLTRPVEEWLAS